MSEKQKVDPIVALRALIERGEEILQEREQEQAQREAAEQYEKNRNLAQITDKLLDLVPPVLRWCFRLGEYSDTVFTLEIPECAPIYVRALPDYSKIETLWIYKAVNYGGGEPYFSENNWDSEYCDSYEVALAAARRQYRRFEQMQSEHRAKIQEQAEKNKRTEQEELYRAQVQFEAGHDPQVQLDEAVNCIITAEESDDLQLCQVEAQIGIGRMLVSIHHQLKRIADSAEAQFDSHPHLQEHGSHGS